ncbi:ABC transporter permease [Wukongibacter sp. M2B1]|uniref:ABC transporter permease n=1 Tax=Wukongibacter sp. M2B1 TaxID=3088895 RepID=UPI003D79B78E
MTMCKITSGILIIILLVSLLAPFIAPYNPIEIDMKNRLSKPSFKHLLGTDSLGRDVFSRLIYGGRTSILLSVIASVITMLLGLVLGIIAGYFGGKLDNFIQILVNIFQALPSISFMIALIGIMGPGIKSILISVVLTSWANFSRIVRGEVLKIREENYIEGAKALGCNNLHIVIHHVIPNIIGPFIVLFTTRIGKVILSIAGLSFLGLGLQPPTPDWGVMISDAKTYYLSNPVLIIAPGMCIMILSLSINLIGDGIRDYLDTSGNAYKQFL